MPPDVTPVRERSLTSAQLCNSPYNVRINVEDATINAELEASIGAFGVRTRLWVHPMGGGRFGVLAGSRRMRSVAALVDRGELTADYPVPVKVYDLPEVDLIALSLDENLERRELRPYEIFSAIHREHELGRSIADLARRHNQTEYWTEKAVRLGGLARPIFDALAEDKISLEQAKAFGATKDHDVQLAAFQALMAGPEHARGAPQIRAWLRVDDREEGRLLRFVGEDVYFAAGGAFEPDLFAGGADRSGRVTDAKLLRQLADAKVATLRDEARARVGRPDLRFLTAAPRNPEYGGPDSILYVSPGGENGTELPDGDVAAVITIAESGEHDVAFWWTSRTAMAAATKVKLPNKRAQSGDQVGAGAAISQGDGYGQRQKADALIKEEAGLTQEGTQIMRSLRRAILRAGLVQDAREGRALGRDYLVWAQLRMQLSTATKYGYAERASEVGMRALTSGDVDSEPAHAQIDAIEAGRTWAVALADLRRQSFLTKPDLAAAFIDFRNASQATRDLAAAVVAGIALERSLDADGYRVSVHDALAVQARCAHVQGLRHWWQPTVAFLELLPTAERRAIVEPFLDAGSYASWAKYKSADLTPLVLRVVQGTAPTIRTMSLKLAAAQWVHPLLRFRVDAGVPPAAPSADVDAAELEETAHG